MRRGKVFNPGDIVVCLDDLGPQRLERGTIYKVKRHYDSKGELVVLEGPNMIDDGGELNGFFTYRFRAANSLEISQYLKSKEVDEPTDIYDETPEIAEIRASYNGRR
jgi:hypothetical protein